MVLLSVQRLDVVEIHVVVVVVVGEAQWVHAAPYLQLWVWKELVIAT